MTPGTLLVRFSAHSDDYFKSPYHPLAHGTVNRTTPRARRANGNAQATTERRALPMALGTATIKFQTETFVA